MRHDNGPRPTLGDLQRTTPWVWVYCEKCPHHSPMACAVAVIRWGADMSSDKLRRSARCTERTQRRDDSASGMGRSGCWLYAFPKHWGVIDYARSFTTIVYESGSKLFGAGRAARFSAVRADNRCRYWFLWVRCPACRTIQAIDLRTKEAAN